MSDVAFTAIRDKNTRLLAVNYVNDWLCKILQLQNIDIQFAAL